MFKTFFSTTSLIFIFLCTTSNAEVFFDDSFESGDLNYTRNGARWTSSTSTTVSSAIAKTGNYSLRFRFEGSSSSSADAWSEQRFDLGTGKTDVYIRYYIYFPKNYVHRDVSPNNNKMIRLWGNDYKNDGLKIGASMRSSSPSRLFPAFRVGCDRGVGDRSSGYGLGNWELTYDRLGQWIAFEFHFKPDSGRGDGILEFWVDGIKQFGATDISIDDAPCLPGYYRNGYLLGWSNSGFSEQTDIYIDDVVFSDSYIGVGTNSSPSPGKPNAPSNFEIVE